MAIDLISRNESSRHLIVIFAGWGTSADFYADVSRPGWDVAVVHSVTDFEATRREVQTLLSRYTTVVLYAWSMGVFTASTLLAGDLAQKITAAYALNGTELPVHDSFGIPVKIFNGTLATLDLRNLTKFRHRMAGDSATFSYLQQLLDTDPDIEVLRSQLATIRDTQSSAHDDDDAANDAPVSGLQWHQVFIGRDDRIFPAQSQEAFWQTHPSQPHIVMLDAPHFYPLSKVINDTLPSPERVGRKFEESQHTYDEHATAQRSIAEHLTRTIAATANPNGDSTAIESSDPVAILEIGAGSGLFTQLYRDTLKISKATFVDLYAPAKPFHLCDGEEYVTADAERWIETISSSTYDYVLSASTIQWFVNPEHFFSNVARALRPGGHFICSTFAPGNLRELDGVRPSPIHYRSLPELRAMLQKHFSVADMTEDTITLTFPTPREALLHLKHTGVGGGASSPARLRSLLQALTPAAPSQPVTLTFRPIYIHAYNR